MSIAATTTATPMIMTTTTTSTTDYNMSDWLTPASVHMSNVRAQLLTETKFDKELQATRRSLATTESKLRRHIRAFPSNVSAELDMLVSAANILNGTSQYEVKW